jgi:hypothetical protein
MMDNITIFSEPLVLTFMILTLAVCFASVLFDKLLGQKVQEHKIKKIIDLVLPAISAVLHLTTFALIIVRKIPLQEALLFFAISALCAITTTNTNNNSNRGEER